MNEDTLTGQTEWIGAAMPHYAEMDMPGIDMLGSAASQPGHRAAADFGGRAAGENARCVKRWAALAISRVRPK